jgi:hypothetical protein
VNHKSEKLQKQESAEDNTFRRAEITGLDSAGVYHTVKLVASTGVIMGGKGRADDNFLYNHGRLDRRDLYFISYRLNVVSLKNIL